ncbi:UNVERIFIED_CONTAM: hypothetical protein Sradi_1403100 [Sesamum radiatum]|uniref:Uncharacterized protein n=1 Tax=Sesamum radiatum TaxID=300843 RepID=A0AAW2UV13_SESRA
MELQETARFRDRERLQRKDRDREFPKRRRVDRSAVQQRSGGGESFRETESTDSSDEEYYEEEEETSIHRQNRMNQVSPTNSSLSNNRRGLRTLRSSPVLRPAADEILGVPVPRRARSAADLERTRATGDFLRLRRGESDWLRRRFLVILRCFNEEEDEMFRAENAGFDECIEFQPSSVIQDDIEIEDPTVTKADNPEIVVEAKKETKLEIDLMAPPLPSSPERVALVDIMSDTVSKNGPSEIAIRMQERNNQLPNPELVELENRRPDVLSFSDYTTPQQQDRKEQKNQSTSSLLPFPIGMSSWPGVLPHPGYTSPLQAVLPIDGSARSSRTTELPPFKFSQPRTKRCATHQCLAHNIDSHQQLIKKTLSSGPTGPSTLYGTKPVNLKSMLPTQKVIPGNMLFGDLQEAEYGNHFRGSGKDKSSDAAAALNTTSSRSVLQQASHQAPANHFLHGPGFIFPLGHHQTTMMAPANSSGPPQSASAVGHASLSSNSAGRPSVNLPLPGGAAAVSFNHPLFPSNEAAPYIALLQNNGCPVPISTNFAMPPFKGGSPTMPFLNSSYYSSPLFNVQNQQQLSLPRAPVQSASQNMSTFSGSSSHKQPQCEQQTSTKTRDSKFPTPVSAHPPQPEKLLQPSHSSSNSFPVQPMNFGVIPPVSIGGGAVGNKHGDPQQGSKGGVELIPQALALSFGSNPSINPALNFTSMVQNSGIFHMLPDMARNANQMAPHSQMAQQKNFQASEGKYPLVGGKSSNFFKGDCNNISSLSTMGTFKFDGLANTVNFLPSSLTGDQSSQSSTAAVTSGVSVTIPNFQPHQHQQHLVQLQKHHMQQLTGAAQVKASAPNSFPGSFLAGSFPSNNPVFTQVSVQSDNQSFPPMWENFSRATAPEGSSQSASSTLVNMPQVKSSHGQTHISFGDSSVPAASFQGQQLVIKSQPVPSFVVGSQPNSSMSKNTSSSLRSVPTLGKAASALPGQETEASLNGPTQKTSPSCRRNVPSILSTCPSQLSELKY